MGAIIFLSKYYKISHKSYINSNKISGGFLRYKIQPEWGMQSSLAAVTIVCYLNIVVCIVTGMFTFLRYDLSVFLGYDLGKI